MTARNLNFTCLKIWVFTLFFVSIDGYSQQVEQDSVQQIKNFQSEAHNAITKQDFDEAIIKLNNATTLAETYSDKSYNQSLQLELAELHFFFRELSEGKSRSRRGN